MQNRLQDMTLEELWKLFPIVLTPYNPKWIGWAEEEMERLSRLLKDYSPLINHIGSTAIPGIQAKPIVDILVETATNVDWRLIKGIIETSGYICMSESDDRISFNKGYTPSGYAHKVFHVHLRRIGDNNEILFRDYLIAHPETAKEYECLKLSLFPKYKYDRDSYTDAKTDFVSRIIELARKKV